MIPLSILIPVHNAHPYLQHAVGSVLLQREVAYELLLLDDYSTDNGIDKLQCIDDPRIRIYTNEYEKGISGALNTGLKYAKGKYVVRMDADDLMLPERLNIQYHFMEQNPQVVVCGTWAKTFGLVQRLIKGATDDNTLRIILLKENPLVHPSTIIRKATLAIHRISYDTTYPHAEDYQLWTQLSRYGQLATIPKVLLLYRVSANQVTQRHHCVMQESVYQIQLANLYYLLEALFKFRSPLLFTYKEKNRFEKQYFTGSRNHQAVQSLYQYLYAKNTLKTQTL